jgi:hypothetical protein
MTGRCTAANIHFAAVVVFIIPIFIIPTSKTPLSKKTRRDVRSTASQGRMVGMFVKDSVFLGKV